MNQPVHDTLSDPDDERIEEITKIIPPIDLVAKFPLDAHTVEHIQKSRQIVTNIIHGKDSRLLVVSGPCSIHNRDEALEYAHKLRDLQEQQKHIFLVMRTYFEKPRTTVGWKWLINDPDLNDECQIEKWLHIARKLLLDINKLWVPTAVEWLDVTTPQYISDLVTWWAIGARTTESQEHRKLASGLSMPVGFKNGTDGNIWVATDAVQCAQNGHTFIGLTKYGYSAQVDTSGNEDGHIILRGGKKPNHTPKKVQDAGKLLDKKRIPTGLIIDVSHGNSKKDYRNQPKVTTSVAKQIAKGNKKIVGVMIEWHLNEWKQDLPKNYQQISKELIQKLAKDDHNIAQKLASQLKAVQEFFLQCSPKIKNGYLMTDVQELFISMFLRNISLSPEIRTMIEEFFADLPSYMQEWKTIGETLKPGVSITDGCVNWETNCKMIAELDRATQKRNILSMQLHQK